MNQIMDIETGTFIRLHGHITPDGRLDLELPAGLPSGDVEITLMIARQVNGRVEVEAQQSPEQSPEQSLTDEELTELLQPDPVAAYLIQTGGWEHLGITDSVEWLAEQRRKRRENRLKR